MGVVDNIKEDIENLIKILNDLLDSAKLLRLTINFINKYRVSNFNFMSHQRIIKLLKSSKILS